MSRYVGNIELEKFDSVLGGMRNLPIVPFFPYFVRYQHYGMVTGLKDAQREHNKRMSQALHHLNSSANSGYTADDDAVEPGKRRELEQNISKSGYIKWVKKGSRFDRDTPVPLSEGHIVLAQNAANEIKMISGVNADLLGYDQKETVSGVAIARRQSASLLATEIVQDNLKLTMKVLGDRTLEAVQKTGAFSQEEVIRLVIDGKEMEIDLSQKMQSIQRALTDISVGRYETYIDTSQASPTTRFANYMMLLEAVKIGIPIPPDVLLDASDLPGKDKIQKAMAAQMQAQQKAQEMALAEKDKDRQVKLEAIKLKTHGDLSMQDRKARDDLLSDVQKAQLEAVKNAGNGKNRNDPLRNRQAGNR